MAFPKGVSGNPKGRPKILLADGRSLADLAKGHTEDAIRTLVEVMGDDDAPPAAKIGAAVALLDRGWGRPAQAVELTGPDGGPVQHAIDMSNWTDEQKRVIASVKLPGEALK